MKLLIFLLIPFGKQITGLLGKFFFILLTIFLFGLIQNSFKFSLLIKPAQLSNNCITSAPLVFVVYNEYKLNVLIF